MIYLIHDMIKEKTAMKLKGDDIDLYIGKTKINAAS